jgi:hypothetical protein
MPRRNGQLAGWFGRHPLMALAFGIAVLGWMATLKNERNAAAQHTGGSTGTPPHEPVSVHSPWYRALTTWTAIFASFAAVGGLVFTAFSVRYQAKQTGLQAAAAQMQVDQQNKQQARLVNVWAADEFSPNNILVTVSNRSQEPVYQFRVYIAFATSGSRGYLAISTWSSFPPCTQVTFNLRAIAESYKETAKFMNPYHLNRFDYGIMFKDATGQAWHRHASGTLHPTPWLEYLTQNGYFSPILPPVFRSFTPLLTDQFTTPEPHQRFIAVGPGAANSCDQNV